MRLNEQLLILQRVDKARIRELEEELMETRDMLIACQTAILSREAGEHVVQYRTLLRALDKDALFLDHWCGNGCSHGFKPACDCPNAGCEDAEVHKLWNEVMA